MMQARVQSLFVVRGNENIPSPKNSTLKHSSMTPGRTRYLRPCRTTMDLARTFGGTFVTGGERGRKACLIPENEDTVFDQEFLTANDPFSRPAVSLDELAGLQASMELGYDDEDEDTLARRLSDPDVQLNQAQIDRVVDVVREDPAVLIALYHMGIHADGVDDRKAKQLARLKTFGLFMRVCATMMAADGKESVNRMLSMHRDPISGKTLLSCLAALARKEKKEDHRHFTAANIMTALGHTNPFASYLR
ncbi:MAG TPA: hypothetical protein VMA75_03265 [Candidatus Paceibacterota bacterium]|nr:hypothetical protein [Candidatus Paceibacterota bacterium]